MNQERKTQIGSLEEARDRAMLRIIEIRGGLCLDREGYDMLEDVAGMTKSEADGSVDRLLERGELVVDISRACGIYVHAAGCRRGDTAE